MAEPEAWDQGPAQTTASSVGKTTQRKSAIALLIDELLESDREEGRHSSETPNSTPHPKPFPPFRPRQTLHTLTLAIPLPPL
jgi:hypothetical protein